MVEAAVRRWRWRNAAEAHPSLHKGCNFERISKLLGSKRNDGEWNAMLMGMLNSVVANMQFPQSRCYQAGWVQHPKCIFCLHAEVSGEQIVATLSSERAGGGKGGDTQKAMEPMVIPGSLLLLGKPRGKAMLTGCV